MLLHTQPRTPRQYARARRNEHAVHGRDWGLSLLPKARYRLLGVHVTRIQDAAYPWDPEIVRAIRVFDPGFVPVFRRKVYKDQHTGLLLTFVHHGVGRFDRKADPDPRIARLPLPSGPGRDFGPINRVERWFEPAPPDAPVNNLPRGFVPFNDWVYGWARETWSERAAQALREEVRGDDEAPVEAEVVPGRVGQDVVNWRQESAPPNWKQEQDEADYRQKEEAPYQKRLMEQLGPDDEREFRARIAGVYRDDPKPFVHVRSA
jgi:hypothetical protein